MASTDGRRRDGDAVDRDDAQIEDTILEELVEDHPDPVSLSMPDFDQQGLLRWTSLST